MSATFFALVTASALASAPAPEARVLRADVSVSHSDLSDELPDWREESLALSRRFGAGWAGALRVEHLERFEREDVYAEARVDRSMGNGSFYVAVGGAPDADFRPEVALKAGTAIPFAQGTRLLVDLDASRFAMGDVYAGKLGVAHQWGERGPTLSLQTVVVSEADEAILLGVVAQGRASLSRRLVAQIGYADAPETSEGAAVRVRGLNAGLVLDVSDQWLMRLDGAREDRGAYTRTEIAVGTAWRF